MPLIPWTTLSAAVVGDDLALAQVSAGALGARTRAGPLLPGFLGMAPDQARQAISAWGAAADAPSLSGARLILTIPTAWCAVRAVPFDARQWRSAREGVMASLEQLVPVAPADALVGVIGRAGAPAQAADDAVAAGGFLLAARRSAVQPWIEKLEAITGASVTAVLAAPMAALGLGSQSSPRAEIFDELAGGMTVRHSFVHGELADLGAPLGLADDTSAASARRLPGVSGDSGGASITGAELAVAAALAERVGAGCFAPLMGQARTAPRRWLVPLAAAALAMAALWGASAVSDHRYQAAIDQLAEQRKQFEPQRKLAEATRAEARRLIALIDQGVNANVNSWASVMPRLAAAQGALPQDGFLYWVRLDAEGLEMRGEAKHAADVLRALESPGGPFTRARLTDPVSTVDGRELETLTVRADRKPAGAAAAPSTEAKP